MLKFYRKQTQRTLNVEDAIIQSNKIIPLTLNHFIFFGSKVLCFWGNVLSQQNLSIFNSMLNVFKLQKKQQMDDL